ncbi:MAG: hypothetical protein AAFO69_21425, partial [Bacteroidota bacterium]
PEIALDFMDSAIVIIEKDMPENHPRIGSYQQQYAALLASERQYDLSNSYYVKAIANYQINYGQKAPKRMAKFQRYYAQSLEKQGLYDSANLLYQQAAKYLP